MFVGAVGSRGMGSSAHAVSDSDLIDYSGNGPAYDTAGLPDAVDSGHHWVNVAQEDGDDYLNLVKKASSEGKVTQVNYPLTTAVNPGETYFFGTDFNLISTKNNFNNYGKQDPWAAKLSLVGEEEFFAIYAYVENTKVTLATANRAQELITLPLKKWVNVNVEYLPTGVNAEGKYTAEVKIVCAGKIVYREPITTDVDNTTFTKAHAEINPTIDNAVVGLDNTYTKVALVGRGSGEHVDVAEKYDSESTSSNNFASITGDRITIKESLNGDKYVEFNRANTTSTNLSPRFNNWDAWGAEKYVFETDINFGKEFGATSGMESTVNSDPWGVKLAFRNAAGKTFLPLAGMVTRDADGNAASVNLKPYGVSASVVLLTETWYNLRVEYTPKGFDGSYYRAELVIYVDGVAAFANDNFYMPGGGYIDSDNSSFRDIEVEMRAYASETIVRFDNTYLGSEGKNNGVSGDDLRFETTKVDQVTKEDDGYHFNVGNTSEQSTYLHDEGNMWGRSEEGAIYRASFDLTMNEFLNDSRDWWAYFGFYTNTTAKKTDSSGKEVDLTFDEKTSAHMAQISAKTADGKPKLGGQILEIGRTYKVDLVFAVTDIGTNMNIKFTIYIDGVYVSEGTDNVKGATDITAFIIKTPSNGSGKVITSDFNVDNLTISAHGCTEDVDSVLDFEDDEDINSVVGKRVAGGTFSAKSSHITVQTDAADATNKVLNFHLSHTATDESDTGWESAEHHTHLIAADLGQAQVGSVYEVTYKIRFNEFVNGSPARSWWVYAGLLTNDTHTEFEKGAFWSQGNCSGNTLKFGNATIPVGEWVYVRCVYTVTSLEDGMSITGTVYVNGKAATTAVNKTYVGNGTNVIGYGFKTPGASTSNGVIDDFNFDIDDMRFTATHPAAAAAE